MLLSPEGNFHREVQRYMLHRDYQRKNDIQQKMVRKQQIRPQGPQLSTLSHSKLPQPRTP